MRLILTLPIAAVFILAVLVLLSRTPGDGGYQPPAYVVGTVIQADPSVADYRYIAVCDCGPFTVADHVPTEIEIGPSPYSETPAADQAPQPAAPSFEGIAPAYSFILNADDEPVDISLTMLDGYLPVYPQCGPGAQVPVVFDINGAGEAVNIRVEDEQVSACFAAAAIAAVVGWRYEPVSFGVDPVAITGMVVVFAFEG